MLRSLSCGAKAAGRLKRILGPRSLVTAAGGEHNTRRRRRRAPSFSAALAPGLAPIASRRCLSSAAAPAVEDAAALPRNGAGQQQPREGGDARGEDIDPWVALQSRLSKRGSNPEGVFMRQQMGEVWIEHVFSTESSHRGVVPFLRWLKDGNIKADTSVYSALLMCTEDKATLGLVASELVKHGEPKDLNQTVLNLIFDAHAAGAAKIKEELTPDELKQHRQQRELQFRKVQSQGRPDESIPLSIHEAKAIVGDVNFNADFRMALCVRTLTLLGRRDEWGQAEELLAKHPVIANILAGRLQSSVMKMKTQAWKWNSVLHTLHAAIKVYIQVDRLDDALKVFHAMGDRANAKCYDDIMRGCLDAGRPADGLRLFKNLREGHTRGNGPRQPKMLTVGKYMTGWPSGSNYSTALGICEALDDRTYAEELLEDLKCLHRELAGGEGGGGGGGGGAAATAAARGEGQVRRIPTLDLQQRHLHAKTMNAELHGIPLKRSYVACIRIAAKTGHWEHGLTLLAKMLEQGLQPEPHKDVYGAVVGAMLKAGKVDKAADFLDVLRETRCATLDHPHHVFLQSCLEYMQCDAVLDMCTTMKEAGLPDDSMMAHAGMAAHNMAGRFAEALQIYEKRAHDERHFSELTCDAIIALSGLYPNETKEIERLTDSVKSRALTEEGKNLRMDEACYCAAIGAFARAGDRAKTLAAFEELKQQEDVEVTALTYHTMIDALEQLKLNKMENGDTPTREGQAQEVGGGDEGGAGGEGELAAAPAARASGGGGEDDEVSLIYQEGLSAGALKPWAQHPTVMGLKDFSLASSVAAVRDAFTRDEQVKERRGQVVIHIGDHKPWPHQQVGLAPPWSRGEGGEEGESAYILALREAILDVLCELDLTAQHRGSKLIVSFKEAGRLRMRPDQHQQHQQQRQQQRQQQQQQ